MCQNLGLHFHGKLRQQLKSAANVDVMDICVWELSLEQLRSALGSHMETSHEDMPGSSQR